jgi:hypothetical protein
VSGLLRTFAMLDTALEDIDWLICISSPQADDDGDLRVLPNITRTSPCSTARPENDGAFSSAATCTTTTIHGTGSMAKALFTRHQACRQAGRGSSCPCDEVFNRGLMDHLFIHR